MPGGDWEEYGDGLLLLEEEEEEEEEKGAQWWWRRPGSWPERGWMG